MLITRFRALPAPQSQHFVQGLIDHFFLDVEERIRQVLQPAPRPDPASSSSNSSSSSQPVKSKILAGGTIQASTKPEEMQEGGKQDGFYVPNPNSPGAAVKKKGRAPEALVSKQMKIFREQWAGLGLAFDIALVKGDEELAAAVWRNFMGARGSQGIAYPSTSEDGTPYKFRRAINVAGEVEGYSKLSLEKIRELEEKDDGSGVHDFNPTEADLYLAYPETMAKMVEYVRREVRRLGQMSDEEVKGEMKIGREWVGMEKFMFGSIPKKVD